VATALTKQGLERLESIMAGHTEHGGVRGLAWGVAGGEETHVGGAGTLGDDDDRPVAPDTMFRISSMTKPVTAVAAFLLIEECRLRLDEPVDSLLPELADRRVLAWPDGSLDDTVPAARPITTRDVLSFRLGLGMDFAATGPQPVLAAMGELSLGAGVPAPAARPATDEWIRRLGTLPLQYQPGERWLYHTGADVLGVLVGRASGQPFDDFLRERLFEPLGMHDTGFHVPPDKLDRFGPCYGADPESGARFRYDPADGQWSTPPLMAAGGDGLVSTVDDYLAFAGMLRRGGRTSSGERLLSRASVELMTTNQLTPEQRADSGRDPSGALGWGLGLGVQVVRTDLRSVGTYGWDGGLGSSWANDPNECLTGVLLTNQMWTSPTPPAVSVDFWTCAYTAME
jgi:CubicO group peptidase (beta-lactamase class C family)